jgi:hexosaminidase
MGNKTGKGKKIAIFLIVLFIGIASVIGILADRGLLVHGNASASDKKAPAVAIIPKPVEYITREGNFLLKPDTVICISGDNKGQTGEIRLVGEYLAGKLRPATGFPIRVTEASQPENGSIYLTTVDADKNLGKEGYRLEVTKDNIILRAYTPEGLFRGIQTIRQMLPAEIEKNATASGINWSIPCAEITDYPTYEWRGMMLDVARHFIKVEDVKRTIDLIAEYKINRFHLHLSDDQGWRIEIKSWPELTKIGGSTEVGGGEGGFYTQEEYTELVNYAKERYITIVPEIDMPGHMNAALASYGELNPDGVKKELYTGINVGFSSLMCRSEITYQFINDVIGELAAITPGEYIHIGGDEASQTSEEDYNYFVGRVNEIVKSHGKTAVGWNPIDKSDGIGPEAILQNWSGDAESAKAKNMKIIMSPPDKAYLDMKY